MVISTVEFVVSITHKTPIASESSYANPVANVTQGTCDRGILVVSGASDREVVGRNAAWKAGGSGPWFPVRTSRREGSACHQRMIGIPDEEQRPLDKPAQD